MLTALLVLRNSPAEGNGQEGDFVKQVVVPQDISSLALPHHLVPELEIVSLEVLACFALEVVLKSFLKCQCSSFKLQLLVVFNGFM